MSNILEIALQVIAYRESAVNDLLKIHDDYY